MARERVLGRRGWIGHCRCRHWCHHLLTYGLWREAAAQREGDLMLRLIDEYDRLRNDIVHVQEWAGECRDEGVDRVDRFAFMATTGLQDFEELDQARFRVSRFFVRTRKLVRAGFLSEDIVSAALDRAAIESVFLELIDPLDKVKAGASYKTDDREFYTALLRRYPEE